MKRIVACVDGSQYATSCCAYAAWIANRVPVEIEVVYVTDLRQFEVPFVADLSGSLGIQPYQAAMGQLQKLEENKAEVILSQAAQVLKERGYSGEPIKTHNTGFLVDCLKELEEDADLIVIGKRGENANFATEHLGSTMERVARASAKPCLVASRSFRPVKKAMLAYQDVPSCQAALSFIRESHLLWELELHLVSVAAKGDDHAEALDMLSHAEAFLKASDYKTTCRVLHGVTSHAISAYAKEHEIDLLLMGAYGHSRVRHLIIGSTTTEMLQDCRLPTLLFR